MPFLSLKRKINMHSVSHVCRLLTELRVQQQGQSCEMKSHLVIFEKKEIYCKKCSKVPPENRCNILYIKILEIDIARRSSAAYRGEKCLKTPQH